MTVFDESTAYDLTQREVAAGDYLVVYADINRVDYSVIAVSSFDLRSSRTIQVRPLRADGSLVPGSNLVELILTPGHPLRGFVVPKHEYTNATDDIEVHPEEQERLMLQSLLWYLRRRTEHNYQDKFKTCVRFLQEKGLLRTDFDKNEAKNYRKAQVTLRNAMNHRPDVFIHSGGYIKLNQTVGAKNTPIPGAPQSTPHVIKWSDLTAGIELLVRSGIFGPNTSIDYDN